MFASAGQEERVPVHTEGTEKWGREKEKERKKETREEKERERERERESEERGNRRRIGEKNGGKGT